MWRIRRSLQALLTAILLGCLLVVQLTPIHADAADTPSLTISQLKITSSNGQFITLYNASDRALDMSKYQLEYFNNYDLSKATSSRLIALSGIVPPHGYFMVNDSALLLCYQLTINSVSLGLSSTSGLVEVLAFDQASPGGPVTPILQDYVGWSKTAAPGAQTLPSNTNAFLQRQPTDPNGNPSILSAGSGSWLSAQPDSTNPCNVVGVNSGNIITTGLNQLLPAAEPPATVSELANASSGTAGPVMPPGDIGLMSPTVTELLPNPLGTGNDSTDEFIELYNPNTVSFDLTGFSLQVGVTTPRTYTFPSGTSLPPQSFTAFYSKSTGLSLSNSGSRVALLDPFGNSIAASGTYGTASDGHAWALAKGKWYWTTTPSPGKANNIHEPLTKKSSGKTSKAKVTKTMTSSKNTQLAGSVTNSEDETNTHPIHVRTLALVAGGALLYGTYEYRTDLANRVNQLKRYLSSRYASRTQAAGRRND